MLNGIKCSVAAVAITFLLTASIFGQADADSKTFSIGVGVGGFFPQDKWKEHRYASGIDQFQKGIAVEFDLEKKFWRWGGMAINFGYSHLGTGDWEEYARSQDDIVDASANMFHVGLLLKPYLITRQSDILKLDLGLNLFAPSGRETFEVVSYKYDFLKSQFGVIIGVEYNHILGDNIALGVNLAGVIVPAGVKYADDENHTIMGFPLTAGVRFLL